MPAQTPVAQEAAPLRRLGPRAAAWRLVALAAGAAILLSAQLMDSSDLFPFTSMAQFAQARDPNGVVVNTCLEGTPAGGKTAQRIPFGISSVGVQRSDVEGNLHRFRADPALLAPLAAHYDAHHPDQPPLASLSLCQDVTHLRDGGPSGRVDHRILATWTAAR